MNQTSSCSNLKKEILPSSINQIFKTIGSKQSFIFNRFILYLGNRRKSAARFFVLVSEERGQTRTRSKNQEKQKKRRRRKTGQPHRVLASPIRVGVSRFCLESRSPRKRSFLSTLRDVRSLLSTPGHLPHEDGTPRV